jgi:ABC-type phosphate transport system substrate-binding protein
MKKIISKMVGALFLLTASTAALAEYAVIVHPDNGSNISKEDVERLFMAKVKSFPDGSLAIPINQIESAASRQKFESDVLGKTSNQLKAHWSKMVFTGKAVPLKEMSNDAEVIELVSKNPSTIGYVDKASVNGNVKVLISF